MAHALQDRFSSMMDERLRQTLVTVDSGPVPIFNTKYEGDPKAGAVKIPVRGDMVVGAYNKATGLAPSEGSTTYQTITDFTDVAVNEIIDGYDAAAVPDNVIADRLESAAFAGALKLDSDGIATLEAQGTAFAGTGTDIYEKIVSARTQLTNNKVPTQGRFLIVSADVYGQLLLSADFVKQSDLSQELVKSGAVGQVAGFTVYESNNLAVAAEVGQKTTNFIAGHSNWCHRIREWIVAPKLVDLDGDANFIGASAVKGRWVLKHKVSQATAVLVNTTTKA